MLNEVLLWWPSWSEPRRFEMPHSQPNFAEMILGWSPSKSVSGISNLRGSDQDGHHSRTSFNIGPYGIYFIPLFLFLAWRTSWVEVGITGHIFWRGPSKDHFTKVWLQLVQYFLKRRLSWEFPIGFYVNLSSAKKSSLKLLSQSQPNFAEMILGWSPSKSVFVISDLRPRWPPQPNLI
jgi:hypothetical protein